MIESDVVTYLATISAVTTLVSTRIYPLVIPENATLPALAYQRISGDHDLSHSGATGLSEARIQFTIQATTYGSAKAVAAALTTAFYGYSGLMGSTRVGLCYVANEVDGYAEQSNEKTVRMDVVIRYEDF